MNSGLYDYLYKSQKGDDASTIKLLDKLSPMLTAGSRYLGYEDAYNDLVAYLLAEIKRLDLHNLRNTTDAGIITYFRQVIHHGIIHLAIKHRRNDNVSYFSELSDGAISSIEVKTASRSVYNNLTLVDVSNFLSFKELRVIYLIYFKCLSVSQVAKVLGVSRQAVNKIKLSALKKLGTHWKD